MTSLRRCLTGLFAVVALLLVIVCLQVIGVGLHC